MSTESGSPFKFLNDFKRGFAKGAVVQKNGRPSLRKNSTCCAIQDVQRRSKNVLSKTMLKHASANVHNVAAKKTFSNLNQLHLRHDEKRHCAQRRMSHRDQSSTFHGGVTSEGRKRADCPCDTTKSPPAGQAAPLHHFRTTVRGDLQRGQLCKMKSNCCRAQQSISNFLTKPSRVGVKGQMCFLFDF